MSYSQLCQESCRQNHVDENPCEGCMRSSCHLLPLKRIFNDRTFTLNYSSLHFSCGWGSTEIKKYDKVNLDQAAILNLKDWHQIGGTDGYHLYDNVVPSFSEGTYTC